METIEFTNKKPSFYIGRITGIILLLAMAGVFFFSAWSKIYPDNSFDSFEWTFIDLGIGSINLAGIIARFMIGCEVLLGLMLLGHIFLKRYTYPAIIALLSVFIIYLLIVLLKQGNNGNCACFGDKLAMKPLDAIYKNIVMIAVTILLMYIYPVKPYKYQPVIVLSLIMLSMAIPYIINPIDISTAPVKYKNPMDLDLLYHPKSASLPISIASVTATPVPTSYPPYDTIPQLDLKTGRHIVAFMSLTCIHCKKTAYLMQIIHRQHPDIPFFMVLAGHPDHIKQFFDETHADSIPHIIFRHTPEFAKLAGPGVPSIYWVNNGVPEYKSVNAYYQLDPAYIERWLHGKF